MKAKQTEQKKIGRIKLSDTQELIAFAVNNKKRHFSIVDKGCNELKETERCLTSQTGL